MDSKPIVICPQEIHIRSIPKLSLKFITRSREGARRSRVRGWVQYDFGMALLPRGTRRGGQPKVAKFPRPAIPEGASCGRGDPAPTGLALNRNHKLKLIWRKTFTALRAASCSSVNAGGGYRAALQLTGSTVSGNPAAKPRVEQSFADFLSCRAG
jgi:hypothetical protein